KINQQAGKILINILHDYAAFSISTIDRFFQQVIRAFARDIGVHGGYALELDTGQVLDESVDNLFFDLSEKENKQLLEWLTSYAEERIENAENWNMRSSILELGLEIFKESYQHKATETNEKLHDRMFLSEYRRKLHFIIDDFAEKAKKTADEALQIIQSHGLQLDDFKGGSRSSMKNLDKISGGVMGLTATFITMSCEVGACYAPKTTPPNIIQAIQNAYQGGLQSKMQELVAHFDNHLPSRNSALIIRKHLNTLGILSDLAMQIRKLTTEQNTMLISDSNLLLNKIIEDSDAPFIYEKSGLLIDHFMIDEFQDTSVLQWKNFLPLIKNSLSSGNENLVVGDVKQSIYRWRNSDWKLLDSQLYRDFNKAELKDENLDTNWRSDRNIVNFNNTFFVEASGRLQEKLDENIEKSGIKQNQLDDLKGIISNAYHETVQKVPEKAGTGRVRFEFIDNTDEEESWREISLKKLPAILEDFQLRGYKPCDVAMLVRTNNEEKEVIQTLLRYKTTSEARPEFSYDIMGTEGLMVESAASVKFLLGILRLLINPDDAVQRTILNFEYAQGKLKLPVNEALKASVMRDIPESGISSLFSTEENEQLLKLKHYALFEMTEKIIALFNLPSWHDEVVFLQAFQDIVYKFTTGKSSDLNSFLQWWDKFGHKQFIATPENEQAFRIMTIHKSKGLDFKAVIIPFCEWELDNRKRNILWCETNVAPFNELPLMPVEYTSKLGDSIFAAQYFREMMHTYIDNLNIAYVAFTRAKHEMIGICPLPKENKDNEINLKTLSSLLYLCLNENQNEFLNKHFKAEESCFEVGEPLIIKQGDPHEVSSTQQLSTYPTCDISDRLKIKHKISLFNREEIDITENPLDYGNLMHEIFCRINTPGDLSAIIIEFIREGRITEEEAIKISSDIDDFWQMPETESWFRKGIQVLNETTILTPEGHLYRPDRIILEGKNATVIDYKFGEHELPSYKRQIENYINLLNRMGYETKAYLCYVKLKKVVAY
ncbi:MAG: UvrD-helicase domain-containing protein, partial [Paludibacter sp.]|nr:UvrD-helicase domain-containing protein [Paludibacter sp.]